MVFGYAGFHLTHEVGAYIGSLGVNTSAHTRKQSNGRSPKRKSGKHRNDFNHIPAHT